MPKKTTKEYTATAHVLGKKYTAKGKTVQEAVSKVKVGVAKGKTILVVSNGKEEKERILNVIQTNRLFNSLGMTKEVAIKNISTLFEGL